MFLIVIEVHQTCFKSSNLDSKSNRFLMNKLHQFEDLRHTLLNLY